MNRALNVMVVEDYDELRESIVDKLSADGHRVTGVAMAEDIDDEPTRFVPDIYIIDLNLPGENGVSLARRIRRHHPDVIIIMATARTTELDRILGYESGANLYLPKPYSMLELRAIVSSIGQRIGVTKVMDETGITLDPLALLFKAPKGVVRVTQDEANLLSAFARTSDQSLERWQVLQHLSIDGELSAENLKVKISRLRKKLSACGVEEPAIVALRDFGYRLCFRLTVS